MSRSQAALRSGGAGDLLAEPSQHLHLHDVGHQDGIDYLVMEFLEGETLADRLQRALPVEQVLKYGIEICDGWRRLIAAAWCIAI